MVSKSIPPTLVKKCVHAFKSAFLPAENYVCTVTAFVELFLNCEKFYTAVHRVVGSVRLTNASRGTRPPPPVDGLNARNSTHSTIND